MNFGFNFRGTPGFVADAVDETYVVSDAFPTIRNGQQFGFDLLNASAVDENAGLDRRLAGYLNQDNNGLFTRFSWILPGGGGDYDLSLAMGNQSFYQPQMQLDLYDDDTIIYTYNIQPTSNGYYRDAMQNLWTAAEWPSLNRPLRIRVLGLFRIRLGLTGGGVGSSILNHLQMTQIAIANPPTWTFGFNFRGTAGFTTDAADETYVLQDDFSPVVRNGQQFGYEFTGARTHSGIDDNAAFDRRLAGEHYQTNDGNLTRFQWFLPMGPGEYDLTVSFGAIFFFQPQMQFDIYDLDTIIHSFQINQGTPGSFYRDAQLNIWSPSEWPTLNRTIRLRWNSETFRLRMGVVGGGQGSSTLTHLRLSHITVGNPPSNQIYVGSGQMRLLSSVTVKPFTFVPATTLIRTYVPTGGVSFGGSAVTSAFLTDLKIYLPTGIVRFSGAANTIATTPPVRMPRATTVPWQDQMTTKGITV